MKKHIKHLTASILVFLILFILAFGSFEYPTKISAVSENTVAVINESPTTFCNPLNISYQYQTDYYSREGADPAIVIYKGEYYLFVSHSSGYWWSDNLIDWNFVYSEMPEINLFAPAVCVYNDVLYLTHSNSGSIYKTTNPKSGEWEYVSHPVNWDDPALFTDDDGRVYCYYGCSDNSPLYVVELDPDNDMALLDGPYELFSSDRDNHGFEIGGDNNELYSSSCWLEGAWMFKNNNKYYLQYAVPGTQYAAYADGCYVSDSPIGPFEYCDNSPISYKATGFSVGAGHGSLFEDLNGRLWKFSTVSISVNHIFERRIMMTPAAFNSDGQLITASSMADYPTYIEYDKNNIENSHPDWNLVSYDASVSASSYKEGYAPSNAVDESIRTWWSAESGGSGEWLQLDLGKPCDVNALQVNFADQDIENVSGRNNSFVYNYTIEFSLDGNTWYVFADHTGYTATPNSASDTSHDYYELTQAVGARYIRITNKGDVPAGGKFSISGLRAFGNGGGTAPDAVSEISVTRSLANPRSIEIEWQKSETAQGYVIRYGSNKDSLNIAYQVIGKESATVNNLTVGTDYWFAVDSYNDSGYTKGTVMKSSVRSTDDIHIETEAYDDMYGIEVENCDEGGKDIAFYDKDDWMTYTVNIKKSGNYKLLLRAAAPEDDIATNISIYSDGEWTPLTSVTVKSTGAWQNWASFYSDDVLTFSSGEHSFRLEGTASGSNINWFELIYLPNDQPSELYLSKTAPMVSSMEFGDYVGFYATVRNLGENDVENTFEVEFYVDGQLLETIEYADGITAGASVNIFSTKQWRAVDGSHSVKVFVNFDKSINENDYADNVFKSRFVVSG